MFNLKTKVGNHYIYQYDTKTIEFKEYLEQLYNTNDLTQLHQISNDYNKYKSGEYSSLEKVETDLHKIFYNDIKKSEKFKNLYCKMINNIYNSFFSEEPYIIFQSFPSIRLQFENNIAVPPHCDSDNLGKHPKGEKNFLIPITPMKRTTRLFIETEPNKGDYKGIDLDYGDIFYFNGNKCIHYNQSNVEGYLRISFDFRIMLPQDYAKYILENDITITNPRDLLKERKPSKMIVGEYYQCMFKNEISSNYYNNKDLILQTRPSFNSDEADACYNYFKNGDPFLTEYKETENLENLIKEFIGIKHCFMTPSGMSAIIAALLACNISIGDEVIIPDYTMIATANAVKLIGATPILIDVDSETYTINLDTIKKHISNKTKAIIHVSLNNRSKNLEEIVEFCKEKNIYLIEDAAQSLGAKYNKKHFGTFGDIGCFSLSSPKIITTGQGGFVITDNDYIANKLIKIKNFGRRSGGSEEYDIFGINLKFTDIQAVIGISQMKKLPDRVQIMKTIFRTYFENLQHCKNIVIKKSDNGDWIPWFIDILVKDRNKLIIFLKKHNIQTRITYPSIHSTPPYNINSEQYANTEHISKNGLFLPTHSLLTEDQIIYICRIIKMFDKIN
jgi:perosamine synthetase